MGVSRIFDILNTFLQTRGIRYAKNFGDGESNGCRRVMIKKSCDPKISVTNLVCMVHVEKRSIVGNTSGTGTEFNDGNALGYRGCQIMK
jgi:hypothetical protein